MSRRRKRNRGNPQTQQHADRPDQPEKTGADDEDRRTKAGSAAPERPPLGRSERLISQAHARADSPADSSPRILVYALLSVAVLMGLYLHAYALPQLKYFAAGQSMPDARPFGYDASDLAALRDSFTDQAAGQLGFLHATAGVIFPVVFFLSAWAVMGLLVRNGRWRWAVVMAAGVFAAVDITENILIDQALGQSEPSAALVATASVMTSASWALLSVVGLVLLTVVVRDLRSLRR